MSHTLVTLIRVCVQIFSITSEEADHFYHCELMLPELGHFL